ncbi:MAG TPA: NAD(P)-dependent alcohol dehydrogenase [Candidatus Limnocylindrales bacterium]|nr:NAD(P)-dependent alcohol dehydrogenase [Candidatus Limnocylindrales bacterium]
MKAAWRDRYGPPHVVSVREVETPAASGSQVLVRVKVAGANRADIDGLRPRWQFIRLFLGLRRPRRPGLGIDLAGVVEAVGPEQARFKVGERVFGELFGIGGRTFAEYALARERELAPIPDWLTNEMAAALPHSGLLALQSLRWRDGSTVGAGERLLVVGASGNVGPYVVQIATARGVHVTAVASGDKLDFVRSLGADELVDYRTTDYTRPAEPYHWIVDVDAHQPMRRWWRALRPGGSYVTLGGPLGLMLSGAWQRPLLRLLTGRRLAMMLWWKPFHPPDVEELLRLVQAGQVVPQVDKVYPLEQVAQALAWLDEGKSRGKVLVVP